METVSVIIPTWNRASTIEAAVRSVLNQTFPVLEVLVCDDGSTDETKNILASINDDRIKFLEGPRFGRPAVPRNRGIKQAKGDWIAFLDSDDAWLPGKLELQINAAKNQNCLASSTNAFRVIPSKGRQGTYLQLEQSTISFEQLIHTNFVICSSAIIHKSILDKVGGFPEEESLKAIEDYALWLRVVTHTDFAYVKEALVDYTDDALNSIRADQKENVQRESVMMDFFEWCKSQPQVPLDRLKRLRKVTRVAMKRNGRSIIERIKLN